MLFDLRGRGGGRESEGCGLCCRSNCVTLDISASSSNVLVMVGRERTGRSVKKQPQQLMHVEFTEKVIVVWWNPSVRIEDTSINRALLSAPNTTKMRTPQHLHPYTVSSAQGLVLQCICYT